MSIPFGRTSWLRKKAQADFTTPAAGNYQNIAYYTQSLGSETPLEDDPVLSQNGVRDPNDPAPGLTNHSGDIEVPLDLDQIGFWLTSLLGLPETTDDTGGNYTHVFKSGAETLPADTIEIALKANLFLQHVGCMVNTLSISTQRQAGYGRVRLGLLGHAENKLTATAAGVPVAGVIERVPAFTGRVLIGDVAVASVTQAELTYANNLEGHEGLRADGLQSGFDTGVPAFSGSMTLRFTDTALYDQGKAMTADSLEFEWAKSATKSLSFKSGRAFIEKFKVPVNGPNGVSVNANWRAALDPNEAGKEMLIVTLKNQHESYA